MRVRVVVLLAEMAAAGLSQAALGVEGAGADPVPRWTWSDAGDGHELSGIAFVDDAHGWICGADGFIASTSDGGLTWTPQESGTSWSLREVEFVDLENGWAAGEGGTLLKTTDGGATWYPEFSGGTEVFSSVDFVDTTHGWACTDATLVSTTDGGESWTFLEAPPIYAWTPRVRFVSRDRGWYIAPSGLYRTEDGGATWVRAEIPSLSGDIVDAAWIDTTSGVMVTAAGEVLTTSNNGTSWLVRRGPSGDGPLRAISVADLWRFWAVGDGGLVIATDDGGSSWYRQSVDLPQKLLDVVVRGERGWACGQGLCVTGRSGFGGLHSPTTSHDAPEFANGPVTVTLSALDDGPEPLSTFFTVDGGLWTAGNSLTLAAPADHTLDGPHTIRVYSVDAAGNDEFPFEFSVFIDTVTPAMTVVPEDKYQLDYWNNTTSTVYVEVVDPEPSSGARAERLDPASGWKVLSPGVVVTDAPRDHSNDGRHLLRVRASDRAGNMTAEETHYVCIDTRKPVSKAPYSSSVRKGSYATLKLKIVDGQPCASRGAAGIVITKLNGRIVKQLNPRWFRKNVVVGYRFKCGLARGTYYYWVLATDGAGNADKTPARNKLTVK